MSKTSITRKPFFWVIFVALSLGCIAFTLKYFSKAMPIVNIDITMDRAQAIKKANTLAKKFSWGPGTHSQAAIFKVDQRTKVFAELECGGRKAFIKMMKDGLYMPYQWIVRHFKEFEKNETYIKFTHEGKPYGFKEIISEDTSGPDISKQAAQKIAEQEAVKNWGVNLGDYKLVESSKEVKPSKRGDHTFVYERPDKVLGKTLDKISSTGFYRLKIVVSGDRVTQLKHFVKIPENFTNKYKEMRAKNTAIASIASFLIMLLYLLGGCIIGLYFLFQGRYIIFKVPIFAGLFIAFLFFVNRLNILPSAWMSYNTVSSGQSFLISYLISSLFIFLSKFFLFTISFMAAESLTRKAFGNHISLWKIWSKNNASSPSVAGRTISGYLLVPFLLAYVVGVYLFTTKLWGWWMPSSELVDPNILSNYLPWLSSFTNSLGAGFWEECLFRAVPLACAALIGKRYGKKNWWIAFAFILQAIIFGAAHANYPAQPSYARLLELILPSFMFAGVYLSFGLLPSIITHFVYDLVLMSLPLFVSSASFAWVNQLTVILLGAIPLLIVLLSRLKSGKWAKIKQKYLNKYWQPPEKIKQKEKIKKITQQKISLKTKTIWFIFAGAFLGAAGYTLFTPFAHNAASLDITQQEATKIATQGLKKRGIQIDSKENKWQALPILAGSFDSSRALNKSSAKHKKPSKKIQQRFVWQYNKKLYKKLLGTYLDSPQWLVRFVKFDGDLQNRAEEYIAFINHKKKLTRIYHKVPEDKIDQKLSEDKARTIAHSHLVQVLHIDPKKLKEIAAKSHKLKNRINWEFIFSDKALFPANKAEARIVIQIDGDDISDAYRYVHVPEEWQRKEGNKQNIKNIITSLCLLILIFIIVFAVILTGKNTTRFSKKHAIIGFLTYFISAIIINANAIMKIIANFDPIKPFNTQLIQYLGSLFISTLFVSGMFGIIIGLIVTYKTPQYFSKKIFSWRSAAIMSLLIGISAIGLYALINFFKPPMQPLWPDLSNLASYYPAISILIRNIIRYLLFTSFIILFAIALNYIYKNWKYKYVIITALFILSGLAINGVYNLDSIYFWVIKSILLALVALAIYLLFVKQDHALIPPIIGVITIAGILQQAIFRTYFINPLALGLSAVIILILSIYWFKKLNK
ncbi:CPBP family intramembrane glutamic endopeptidase [Candidatus Dependentiae bacterium]